MLTVKCVIFCWYYCVFLLCWSLQICKRNLYVCVCVCVCVCVGVCVCGKFTVNVWCVIVRIIQF